MLAREGGDVALAGNGFLRREMPDGNCGTKRQSRRLEIQMNMREARGVAGLYMQRRTSRRYRMDMLDYERA